MAGIGAVEVDMATNFVMQKSSIVLVLPAEAVDPQALIGQTIKLNDMSYRVTDVSISVKTANSITIRAEQENHANKH